MNKAQQNLYMEIADRSMYKAIDYTRRLKRLKTDKQRLLEKYQCRDKQPSSHKLVFILASISHFCLAILAGINLEDVFYAAHTSIGDSFGIKEGLRAILPIAGILGLSLIMGMLISRIEPAWDLIIPKKLNLNHRFLIGTAVGLVIYFSLLYHVVGIGIDMAPKEAKNIVQLILFLGVLELFTGFFAAIGWEIILYQIRKQYYNRRTLYFMKMEKMWRIKSAHYYYYYLQSLPDSSLEPERRTVQQVFPEIEWEDY